MGKWITTIPASLHAILQKTGTQTPTRNWSTRSSRDKDDHTRWHISSHFIWIDEDVFDEEQHLDFAGAQLQSNVWLLLFRYTCIAWSHCPCPFVASRRRWDRDTDCLSPVPIHQRNTDGRVVTTKRLASLFGTHLHSILRALGITITYLYLI